MGAVSESRPSRHARGYDAAWLQVRKEHLRREPLCRFCMERRGRATRAAEVDHIVSIKDAPHLRLDHANLRSLCKSCHSRRTYYDQGLGKGLAPKGCDASGVPVDPRHHWRGGKTLGLFSPHRTPLARSQSR